MAEINKKATTVIVFLTLLVSHTWHVGLKNFIHTDPEIRKNIQLNLPYDIAINKS